MVAAALALLMGGCKGSSPPKCSFQNPATLAPLSPWPKFRHDVSNTGTANVTVMPVPDPTPVWVFPAAEDPPQGSFVASPIINNAASLVFVGSTNGVLYALNIGDPATQGTQSTTFALSGTSAFTASALAGVRGDADAIFAGGGDGRLYGVDDDGNPQSKFWPFTSTGFIAASPTISTADGTVFVGSLAGNFFGVCPNAISRFGLTITSVQTSAAIGPDFTVYFGASDQQLRATLSNGTLQWAFSASAPILSSPVIEVDNSLSPPATVAIYVADQAGRIFKVASNGLPIPGFSFGPVGPITSSPALAGDVLYVGSEDTNLYAIDKTTGTLIWSVHTGGAVASSPAVATGGNLPIVVVGSNDGNVYFVEDDGSPTPSVSTFVIGSPVRSSPALGSDGTVYIGADDGRVYAIH